MRPEVRPFPFGGDKYRVRTPFSTRPVAFESPRSVDTKQKVKILNTLSESLDFISGDLGVSPIILGEAET